MAQIQEQSALGAIKFLTQPQFADFLDGCGPVNKYRAAAAALAKLGDAALPAINAALDSVEELGEPSKFAYNAELLLLADAGIRGPVAYSRLARMIGRSEFAFISLGLDRAAAVSLGLTSYVSSTRTAMRVFNCGRTEDPRDALDQLILAWETDDRASLQASLGPNAQANLNSVLDKRTWADLRAQLWPSNSSTAVSVGYQFVNFPFLAPEGTLEVKGKSINTVEFPVNTAIEVLLKNKAGRECARYSVEFIKVREPGGPLPSYVIDNRDSIGLLKAIASCANNKR